MAAFFPSAALPAKPMSTVSACAAFASSRPAQALPADPYSLPVIIVSISTTVTPGLFANSKSSTLEACDPS